MAEAKHTPAPWSWEEGRPGSLSVRIGDTYIGIHTDSPEADARLIAAAPALLAACIAQHEALDILLAGLVQRDQGFMPSKSAAWPAMQAGHAAIIAATRSLP